jgi:Rod binding domain-containing protein
VGSLTSAAIPAGALLDVPPAPGNSKKIEDSAMQFEGLLIGQMLKSARESGSGSALGDDEDSSSETMLDVADQQFSQVLSNNGGLGLARLLVQGLSGPGSGQGNQHTDPS